MTTDDATASPPTDPRELRIGIPASQNGRLVNRSIVADMWWKNAVVYCLDVETFADSDGDGIGDFGGLIEHVSHLAGLGVTCLWLMPFYPTRQLDDGYDITEHYGIDARLGDFGDFTEFMTVASENGLRVIADLVVNHTSDQHPWFQSARRSRDSPFRDFYVWRDEIPDDGPDEPMFPGQQESVWTWDPEAEQYYLHRFFRHQPDLNIASPDVRNEIRKVIGFWLAQGLSGFRVDAVPFLLETAGITQEMQIEPHQYLRDIRAFVQRRRGDAILLGEVNVPYPEQRPFFGDEDGDEIDMLFDFVGNQHLFLALARQDATPIAEALGERPRLARQSTYATFVRNHDELNLNRLDEDECNEIVEAFGPEPGMQLFGRGLRRRLPTMLGGDVDRIRMTYSLMFSLPGTPTIFYGEEIGMGENLDVEGRMAVRTPMQWDSGDRAGFTTAPAVAAVRQIPGGDRGPDRINVRQQRREPDSLLSWFERLVRLRKEHPEIGWGRWEVLDCDDPAVLALRYDWKDDVLVAVHHLADRPTTAVIRLESGCSARDLWGSGESMRVDEDGTVTLELDRYDHSWLLVRT